MANNEERKPFIPFTSEQRKEFGKQFTPEQKTSYYKGKRQAYSHASNMARRESIFVSDNLKNDTAKATAKPKGKGKQSAKDDLPF